MVALWSMPFLWAVAACIWVASACDMTTHTFTTKDGRTYVYDYAPAKGDNPTLLLLHGFPTSRRDWDSQIPSFLEAGYGVILPDIIGFGDSDRPIEYEAYPKKTLAGHFVELIDELGLDTVVGAGHDWGGLILSSAAVFYKERFSKFIFLSSGYMAPGALADVDVFNKMTLEQLGYMAYGYWYFNNAIDAAPLCRANLESCFHMMFPTDEETWPESFTDLGAARAWLTAGKTAPLPDYQTQEYKDDWIKAYSRENAVETAMHIYKSQMRGVNFYDEVDVTEEEKMIHVPVLTITGTLDKVVLADQVPQATSPYCAAGYTEGRVEAGHWMLNDHKEDTNALILEFLAK